MRKPSKYGIFAVIMFLAFVVGSLAALIDNRKAARPEPPRPTYVVFKDNSPKPPEKEVDTMPPLSAEECVSILNESYKQIWAEEQKAKSIE